MNTLKIIIIMITAFYAETVYAINVENYIPFFGVYVSKDDAGALRFSLRKYTEKGVEYLVTVDPVNLNTYIERTSSKKNFESDTLQQIRRKYSNTNYIKALVNSERNSTSLQNAGITHFPRNKSGVVLTADLCPSKLPIDKIFFTTIIDEFIKIKKPVPIALSITGLWIENHTEEIKWLKALEEKSLLSITWINHSYNHSFSNDLPLNNNFLLMPDTNIRIEVLDTEKKILEAGLIPSVFFRFPGLISNSDIFHKITGYGLIPVGSDAWLGKDEWPKKGSIVLVHANGNEPAGLSRFNYFIKRERKNILNKHWIIFDLRESMAENITNK
jgi:hypothetical protein